MKVTFTPTPIRPWFLFSPHTFPPTKKQTRKLVSRTTHDHILFRLWLWPKFFSLFFVTLNKGERRTLIYMTFKIRIVRDECTNSRVGQELCSVLVYAYVVVSWIFLLITSNLGHDDTFSLVLYHYFSLFLF